VTRRPRRRSPDELAADPELKPADLGADVPIVARASRSERVGESFDDVLAAARTGAEWAMAVLYRSLQPRLLRFLGARAPQDAEDIASQAWLEVARGLPRFSGGEDEFGAFVFTVARRRLADHRRATRRRPVDPTDDETLTALPDASTAEQEAVAHLGGEEAARRIAELLPAEQAEIILLRVVGGLSVDEVARIVGRRPGTVRVLQHRALRRLAAKLGDDL
jgi:RNA polymerase sigma-70 factor, ECF subfamily